MNEQEPQFAERESLEAEATGDPAPQGDTAIQMTVEDEIESLLREAEVLTDEIASEVGPPIDDILAAVPAVIQDDGELLPQEEPRSAVAAESEPAAMLEVPDETTPPAVESETIEAAISAANDAEVDAILGSVNPDDVDEIATAHIADEPLAGSDTSTARALNDLLNDPESGPDEAVAAGDVLYIPEEDATADAASVETESPPSDDTTAIADTEVTEPSSADASSSVADSAEPVAARQDAPTLPIPRVSLVARLLAIPKVALRVGMKVLRTGLRIPKAGIAIGVKGVVLLDAPFRRVGDGTRHNLGIVAIATIVCGVLAWVLPWLLTSNPFEDIPPGIVTGR